ncbi:MAG: hypothetical protein RBQ81_05545 [Arcobacteraceae bacterium]|jgi:hypothetical protein|nr:hypothetical protein [Arcobacteraceae bacterium]
MRGFIAILFVGLFIGGCSVKYDDISMQNNQLQISNIDYKTKEHIESLAKMISNISYSIDTNEAYDLAKNSIYYSMYLANRYDLVKPPSFQNFLVNQKLREKGLCYHFASDLGEFLLDNQYKTISLYRVVANEGSYFLEHHALSITAKEKTFKEGIVLDAWRKSGNLFFTYLKEDKEYKWKLKKQLQ